MYLEKIRKPNDIKELGEAQLPLLAEEIREFLLTSLSRTGGHLASNLGTVELTIALHRVMSFPQDKLIWDVGHQSYTHKLLTGRMAGFENLRQYGGMSGFPKRAESETDVYDTGHSSTSISAGLGFVAARRLAGEEDARIVSVIGDGSLTGGEAFEALNNSGSLKKNFVVVLNDNNMSISKNVGGMSVQLTKMRTSPRYTGLKEGVITGLGKIPVAGEKMISSIRKTKSSIKQLLIPGMLFEELGFLYIGPVDGHDIEALERVFAEAFAVDGPVLVHVVTKKGKGYPPAERYPSRFHGIAPFNVKTGRPNETGSKSYTDAFSVLMRHYGKIEPRLCGVTAAMSLGVGLAGFAKEYPDRFFDVGIAEQHAVSFACALALSGYIPVVAVYSSFLQRAYDQIIEDVCLQNAHVIFAVDRAGLVGADGETHQGIFDLSYLSMMPNMTVLAPKNMWELKDMFRFALTMDSPVAIRYPKGEAYTGLKEYRSPVEPRRAEPLFTEGRILLFAAGSMVKTAEKAREMLLEDGIETALCNARFVHPFDREYVKDASERYDAVITLEENVRSGGFGEQVGTFLSECGYTGRFASVAIDDRFVPHGDAAHLKQECGIDEAAIVDTVKGIAKELS